MVQLWLCTIITMQGEDFAELAIYRQGEASFRIECC